MCIMARIIQTTYKIMIKEVEPGKGFRSLKTSYHQRLDISPFNCKSVLKYQCQKPLVMSN